MTSLLLALQWGGNAKPWNSPDVIATLVVAGVLAIVFVIWEWYKGDSAMLPVAMVSRPTLIGCCLEAVRSFNLCQS